VPSPNELESAYDALDLAETNDNERKTLWRMLSAYQLTGSYEEFCSWLGLQINDRTQTLYDLAHHSYAAAWDRYGWERLQVMCRIGWNGLYLNDRRLM
jgi:hypothetical protein